jgi:hypothetical protein
MSSGTSFTSAGSRLTMVAVVFLPALAVLVSYGPNGFAPVVPLSAIGGGALAAALLWRRHGRITFETNVIRIYNWGLSTAVERGRVDGFVWRAPQTFLPYGHGIAFVVEDRTNGIGIRMVSGIASGSLHLSRTKEAALMDRIMEWKPGMIHYRLPPKWRSISPLVPGDSGTVDPPPPHAQP